MLTIPFSRSRSAAQAPASRWSALPTVLMSLANLPIVFDDEVDLPLGVRLLVSLLGVLGLVAAVGLWRRSSWGAPAVFAIGVINAVLGAVTLATGDAAGVVGVVLGLLAAALVCVPARGARSEEPS